MKNLKTISSVFTTLVMMFAMSVSHATTLSFSNVTNNGVTDLSSQLSVDVTADSNYAYFKFENDVDNGIYSSITDIYFDYDTTLTSIAWSADSGAIYDPNTGKPKSGVLFTDGASPGDLPAPTAVDFTADYSADSDSPVSEMGVNTSLEYITFMVALSSAFDYQNLMGAIFDGSFRIGMHIQAITDPACATSTDPDCGSDSYVNVVPVPAAAWLFGTALFGFFATSRRKKNS